MTRTSTGQAIGTRTLRLAGDDVRDLRRLAGSLGLYQTTGAGAGELGNLSEMMRRLAVAWRQDPEAVRSGLASLGVDKH